jgi:predicted nucleotidyltransferase
VLTIDLKAHELDIVRRILAEHMPKSVVRVFGSRVDGRAKPYSDLDLAVDVARSLTLSELARLEEAFEESSLPFRVDVVDWHCAKGIFRDRVEQHSVILNLDVH